jgi:hypothetical protein
MAGPLSRPSMNTVFSRGSPRRIHRRYHDEQQQARNVHHRLDEQPHWNGLYVVLVSQCSVPGWPGQRPGHDEAWVCFRPVEPHVPARKRRMHSLSLRAQQPLAIDQYECLADDLHFPRTAVRFRGNDSDFLLRIKPEAHLRHLRHICSGEGCPCYFRINIASGSDKGDRSCLAAFRVRFSELRFQFLPALFCLRTRQRQSAASTNSSRSPFPPTVSASLRSRATVHPPAASRLFAR